MVYWFSIFFLTVFSSTLWSQTLVQPAKNVKTYWIENSQNLDLSGLSFCHGKLLTLSDDKDDTIYEISFKNKSATLEPFIEALQVPPKNVSYRIDQQIAYEIENIRLGDRLDLEAITCDNDHIYLLSERKNAILKIDHSKAQWLTIDWYSQLRAMGFLNQPNAYGEGLTKIGADFFLGVERESRGIFQLTPTLHGTQIQKRELPEEQDLNWHNKNKDLSDLFYDGKHIYTLERNAYSVCQRTLPHLRAVRCFSYEHVELSGENRYTKAVYGLAEGLAVNNAFIYVVLDNNGQPRITAPEDRRALLIRFDKHTKE
jgi:SdiA-regulated